MTPPKPLTPAERAAVDAFIAAGRLKRIPLGVYADGVDTPMPLAGVSRPSASVRPA